MNTQQHRKQIFRGGVVMLVLGAMLGITGYVSSPAGASDKVTICHRTSSVTNPYRRITVDLSATQGPDHTTHTGPVFDPLVNTKKDKGDWGDIIPNGLNWDAGQALYAAGCQLPGELPDPEVCVFNDDLDATDPGCVPPVAPQVCPQGQVGVFPDCATPESDPEPLVCPQGQVGVFPDCATSEPDPEPLVCPQGQVGVFPDCATPESDPESDPEPEVCPPGQTGTPPRCEDVRPEVIPTITPQESPQELAAPVVEAAPQQTQTQQPTQVMGLLLTAMPAATSVAAPVAAALPRTGTDTLPLAQFGLGLLLLGAGAVIVGREQVSTA